MCFCKSRYAAFYETLIKFWLKVTFSGEQGTFGKKDEGVKKNSGCGGVEERGESMGGETDDGEIDANDDANDAEDRGEDEREAQEDQRGQEDPRGRLLARQIVIPSTSKITIDRKHNAACSSRNFVCSSIPIQNGKLK